MAVDRISGMNRAMNRPMEFSSAVDNAGDTSDGAKKSTLVYKGRPLQRIKDSWIGRFFSRVAHTKNSAKTYGKPEHNRPVLPALPLSGPVAPPDAIAPMSWEDEMGPGQPTELSTTLKILIEADLALFAGARNAPVQRPPVHTDMALGKVTARASAPSDGPRSASSRSAAPDRRLDTRSNKQSVITQGLSWEAWAESDRGQFGMDNVKPPLPRKENKKIL